MLPLVKNWKEILLYSYSMWATYIGIALLIAPEALYYFLELDTNPHFWWITSLLVLLFGNALGRILDQKIDSDGDGTPDWRDPTPYGDGPDQPRLPYLILALALFMGAAPAPSHAGGYTYELPYEEETVMRIAVPMIAKWEGLRTEAYRDIVGVWTVCYGETKGVKKGDKYTPAQCAHMLQLEVARYRNQMLQYTSSDARRKYLTPARDASFTDLAYNVGVGATGKSTAMKRLNVGEIPGACEALTWYNRAGGRIIRGIVNRRADGFCLCRIGLKGAPEKCPL